MVTGNPGFDDPQKIERKSDKIILAELMTLSGEIFDQICSLEDIIKDVEDPSVKESLEELLERTKKMHDNTVRQADELNIRINTLH